MPLSNLKSNIYSIKANQMFTV